jgi:queuine tRNA-ribosyltransferase
MGMGTPADLVEMVAHGVDLFDCVLPTRNARNGCLFTASGRLQIKRSEFRDDDRPIDEICGCAVCRNYSRAYLRHLYVSGEILSMRLNTLHNLHHYADLMEHVRAAIDAGRYDEFRRSFQKRARSGGAEAEDANSVATLKDG